MKNKKVIFILVIAVIAIWGLIIYRLLEDKSSVEIIKPNSKTQFTNEIKLDTFSIINNYRDPFQVSNFRKNSQFNLGLNRAEFIGKKNAIFDRKKDLQKGLIIMKSLGPNNLESIKKYKELGYKIGAIDEEGMMFFSESDYCASRFAQNIAFVDIFFCIQ